MQGSLEDLSMCGGNWKRVENNEEGCRFRQRFDCEDNKIRFVDLTQASVQNGTGVLDRRKAVDSLHQKVHKNEFKEDFDFSVPEYVACCLALTINTNAHRKPVLPPIKFQYDTPIRFRWLDLSAYDSLNAIMEGFVNEQEPKAKRSYLRTSQVRLLEWSADKFEEVDSCVVETKPQWTRKVPQMIAHYCGSGTTKEFMLDVVGDFEWFTVETVEANQGRNYNEAIRKALAQTSLKNFNDEIYWPKKVLRKLFEEATVKNIIDARFNRGKKHRSSKLNLTQTEREQFLDWLMNDRIRLLANAIWSNVKIDFLWDLRRDDSTIQDISIPLDESALAKYLGPGDLEMFCRDQKGFRPIDFPKPGDSRHLSVPTTSLVPIQFDSEHNIGIGGTSTVFRARIHSDYHAFTPDKDGVFALKKVCDSAINMAHKEVEVWQYIASLPHKHITTFHASWSQGRDFYMLSPLAGGNLRDFLEGDSKFDYEKDTEWLLEQIEGITSGLQHIHHIGRAGLSTSKSSGNSRDCGYHHDLKPDNVLVFASRNWKISDFGTAKLRHLVSSSPQDIEQGFYTYNLPQGDAEYGGPDRHVIRKPKVGIGRSYDIYSLGCILLEVLLWAVGEGGTELKKFREARSQDPNETCTCPQASTAGTETDTSTQSGSDDVVSEDIRIPNFWYMCSTSKNCHLKTCVERKLVRIKEQTKSFFPLLSPLCDLVRSMLDVKPRKRPSASVILDKIGILRVKAKVHARKTQELLTHEPGIEADIEVDLQSFLETRSRYSSPSPSANAAHSPSPNARAPTNRPAIHQVVSLEPQVTDTTITFERQHDLQGITGNHLSEPYDSEQERSSKRRRGDQPQLNVVDTDGPDTRSGPQRSETALAHPVVNSSLSHGSPNMLAPPKLPRRGLRRRARRPKQSSPAANSSLAEEASASKQRPWIERVSSPTIR